MKTHVHSHAQFLEDGGRVGELMRAHDWSSSPLGPPAEWPLPLLTLVGVLLQSRFPMFVAWGKGLGFLYNDSYAEILGAKHPRALGRRFREIWPEIWADISPLIDSAMAGNATYREDLPLVMNRKGFDEQTWFTFSYSPVRDESGQVAGMFCAVSETTSRVLAERRLRELNETLERRVDEALAQRKILADIVEGTNAFVQVLDLDYRWLAINHAASMEFERIFGVRPQVGDIMLDALAGQPGHQAAVKAMWARALAGEEFVEIAEFGDRSRDRRSYEMRYNVLRDRDGRRIGAYQFVYDVTERLRDQERLRQAQEALRQAQKMESLGQLTGGVAHDFNNLLAVFSNGLQVLERGGGEEQRKRVYASMRRAVTRGSELTHQLLSFSRRQPINPHPIDLAEALWGMRELLARAQRGDIELHMDLAPELWPVLLDAGEFELAMLNLCVNARDAMQVGGTISIAARNLVQADADGAQAQFVRLTVSDTGSGIAPHLLGRVLEPFFTTKEVGKGSGLGLAQVYGFVQQSGGQVRIESEVGKGTTVILDLPRAREHPPRAASTSATPHATPVPAGARGHVLLVEDDGDVAALTREMLAAMGLTVTHAASAAAALGALANERPIDFVFSDVMIPGGMNGLDLARQIKARRPRLPIILTTGNAESVADMKRGEFELLLKPYDLDDLMAALRASSAW